jgi:hypothetical protein
MICTVTNGSKADFLDLLCTAKYYISYIFWSQFQVYGKVGRGWHSRIGGDYLHRYWWKCNVSSQFAYFPGV